MAKRGPSAVNCSSNAKREELARRSRSARWLLAVRLKTLGLSVVPVLAGTWFAAQSGFLRVDILAVTILSAAAIQIGTNLWNDAADAFRGTDGPDRLGPPRMTSLGLLAAEHVRAGALLAFVFASASGLYLTVLGGWPIAVLGLVSLSLGFCYSMGPYPLSGSPVGEALVIAFFGIAAVSGTAYLHGVPPNGKILLLGVVIGLPAAAVLLANNHRDRQQDARSGRRTLAIVIGIQASRALFAVLLLSSIAGSVFLVQPCALGALSFVPAAALAGFLIKLMACLPVSSSLNRLIFGTSVFQVLILLALVVSVAICSKGTAVP
ncbi:1,4-dihydroxy-2-naphthoate octaprenyltransferase [Leisingera sp. D0M16]|uniref:1,4-dihydroxy-2-naphthoate octaprenyltransferase n=1 Tax=Leisingera coralii TaxID=3351347 RepID=UPI003B75FFED